MFKRSLIAIISIISFACVDHSATDPRTFHCEVLDNGLTVLLVEDPNATESAAAMYVDVGSTENPLGREGLAHFLEHMLFITTDEYPKVDTLSEYVSSHGGRYNAFTAEDKTQYFFSVKPDYFQEGLNIFTSFFINPLFEEGYVDRERHAVHSEFIVSKESDGWRQYHLTQTLLSDHPANRFICGNLDTLEMEGLRDDLVAFYNAHYSSDRMYFAAVVPKDAQEILPYIKQRLSKVKKRGTKVKDTSVRYIKEDLGRVIYYKPVNDMDELNIRFVIPSSKQQYLKPSVKYIAPLVGDEGTGSIIHALRQADLATQLMVHYEAASEVEDIFEISVKLTKNGMEEIDEVICTVMSYIRLVTREGVDQFRFNEMQKVSFLKYLYYNQQDALTQVNQLVSNMKDYPKEKWFNVGYVLEDSEFDPSHIQLLLSKMRLDNALITISSKSVDVDATEPIYGIEYSVSEITEDEYEDWNSESDFKLALPKPNAFIPDNIELLDVQDTDVPVQVYEESWYKRGKFEQPKQMIGYAKVLPSKSPEDVAQLMLLVRLLEQEKMASLYPVITAGGHIVVGYDDQGITIEVSGMGDKQSLVLSQAIRSLYNLEKVSELQFEQARDEIMLELEKIENQVSYQLLFYQLGVEMTPSRYDYDVLLKILDNMTLSGFKKSLRSFLSQSKGQRFYYGNIDPDNVKRLSDPIVAEYNPIVLPVGEKVQKVSSTRSDNAVVMYFQSDGDTDRDHLCSALISQVVSPQMFKQLRTEEQMGYIVGSRYTEINRWPAVVYLVQSPSISTKDIKARIETFIKDEIVWDEALFETIKQSMIKDLEKPFKTMAEEYGFYWNQIHSGRFDYDKKQRMKSELEKISFEDVQAYYQHMIEKPRLLSLMTD